MEEQGPARGAERQVTKLVEDDEIGVGEPWPVAGSVDGQLS
jgi:hypothetical protein